jgi:hypothetical protein
MSYLFFLFPDSPRRIVRCSAPLFVKRGAVARFKGDGVSQVFIRH